MHPVHENSNRTAVRLSRASTSSVQSKTKTWMAGTSPAMTSVCFYLNTSCS